MGERRDSVRVGDSIQLRTITEDGETTFTSGASLSEAGIFVEFILPYVEGTTLRVEFRLPEIGTLNMAAEVVSANRYLAPDTSNRTGNGLRFVAPSADDSEKIRRFIDTSLRG